MEDIFLVNPLLTVMSLYSLSSVQIIFVLELCVRDGCQDDQIIVYNIYLFLFSNLEK